MNSLECFLYRNGLAATDDPACVAAIVQATRHFNVTAGITGLLAFDGQCFFHYVEGPPQQLRLLVEFIARNPRLAHFTPLFPQVRIESRRFGNWSFAPLVMNEGQQVLAAADVRGLDALARMQQLQSRKVH